MTFDIIVHRLETQGTQHFSLRERNTSSGRTNRELAMEKQQRDSLQVGHKLNNHYNHNSIFYTYRRSYKMQKIELWS